MPEVIEFGIPKKSAAVNLGRLHPEIRYRVRVALATDGLEQARSSSGARPEVNQIEYRRRYIAWRNYQNGTGPKVPWAPLAADPNRVWPDGRRGSAHMVQKAGGYKVGNFPNEVGWAYAIDIGFWGNPSLADKKLLETVLRRHGMVRNVPSEWWHFVPIEAVPPYKARYPMSALTGFGDRSQRAVEYQNLLARVTIGGKPFYTGKIDGAFGKISRDAAERFQMAHGLAVNGDWSIDDRAKGLAVLKSQSSPSKPRIPAATKKPAGKPKTKRAKIRDEIKTARASLDRLEALVLPKNS